MPEIRVKLDGREYEWIGGMGCIISSTERGVIQGQVRIIQDILFYAYNVYPKNVWWTIIDVDMDKIRKVKYKLLGME